MSNPRLEIGPLRSEFTKKWGQAGANRRYQMTKERKGVPIKNVKDSMSLKVVIAISVNAKKKIIFNPSPTSLFKRWKIAERLAILALLRNVTFRVV